MGTARHEQLPQLRREASDVELGERLRVPVEQVEIVRRECTRPDRLGVVRPDG